MRFLARKARPLIKCYGGKAYLARWIVSLLPEHAVYVEPFSGGLNVLLNKPRAWAEVVCDVNASLVNLYQVVGSPVLFPLFADLVCRSGKGERGLEYNESTFLVAKLGAAALADAARRGASVDRVAWAVQYLVSRRYSCNGLGEDFAWSNRLRGGLPGDENAWLNFKADLHLLHERLCGVDVRLVDGISARNGNTVLDVVKAWGGPDAVFYCDPPYPRDTRTVKTSYADCEMTDQEHLDLLNVLVGVQARGIFLSTYWNDMYAQVLGAAGWDYTFRCMPNHSGRGASKQRRREILWFRV